MNQKETQPAPLTVANILDREARQADANAPTTPAGDTEHRVPVYLQIGTAPTHQLGHVGIRSDGRVNPVDLAGFLHAVADTVVDLTGVSTTAGEVD